MSAWTIRATAAECLLPVTGQAIRKHLRDRGVGAGVAPEFMAERNSELVGARDGTAADAERPEIAESRVSSLAGGRPCFRVRARIRGDLAGAASWVRKQLRMPDRDDIET